MCRLYKFCAVVMLLLLVGCSKSENPAPESGISDEEKKLNLAKEFVYVYTKDAYLWNSVIPASITIESADTPEALLDKMMYKPLDKWSYVSDNSESEMDQFQGVSTTYGYSLALYQFSNTNDLFAVVKFVYEGSPARKAGIKRGDIILTLNGSKITDDNYLNLYYSASMQIGMGKLMDGNTIGLSGVTYNLVAQKMYEDPVLVAKVIDKGSKKVGYLAYAGFYAESHDKLVEVFTDFKTKGVTDLVIDLRYNPGGNALTPPFLASLFAPSAAVRGGKVFLSQIWNDTYTKYFAQQKEDLNIYFEKDIPVNLDLNRVYLLTTSGTASASEAVISGLMPYMDVVKIGTKSHGKYCAAALLHPTDSNGEIIEDIENWLLSLVIYKFVNTAGFTDFVDGIDVDYEVADDLLRSVYPLGDERDPHLAKALSLITGVKSKANESCVKEIEGIVAMPELDVKARRSAYNMYDFK